MDRQKKRLGASLASLGDDIAGIGKDISTMEDRARSLVETALEETDPRLFVAFHDAAKAEIEKVGVRDRSCGIALIVLGVDNP